MGSTLQVKNRSVFTATQQESLSRQNSSSKFREKLMSKRDEAQTTMTYVKQLSKSAKKMKNSLEQEFKQTIKDINLEPEEAALIRQKTIDRINHLKEQRLKRTMSNGTGRLSDNRSPALSRFNTDHKPQLSDGTDI